MSRFSNTVMSVNGRGTWYVRPMPSRHRVAESSVVTVGPAKEMSPASGDRSPEMRPNRLVLPAAFGPTIPTVSPAPTLRESFSAMTTRPNRFVTWSSSSSGLVIRSLVGRLQVAGELHGRQQRVVDHLGLELVLGALLPLDADRRGGGPPGGGAPPRPEAPPPPPPPPSPPCASARPLPPLLRF